MPERSSLPFLLLAPLFIVAIGLLAALQPVPPVMTMGPVPAMVRHFEGPRERAFPNQQFQRQRRAPNGQAMAQPQGQFGRRPYYRRAEQEMAARSMRTSPGYTLDGWRLLAALGLSGGLTGLVWSTMNGRTPNPVGGTTGSALQDEVARLRDELDQLRRDQRHIRATVDWQGRLLTNVQQPEPEPGAGPAAPASDPTEPAF